MSDLAQAVHDRLKQLATTLPPRHTLTWTIDEGRGLIELVMWAPGGYSFSAADIGARGVTTTLEQAVEALVVKVRS